MNTTGSPASAGGLGKQRQQQQCQLCLEHVSDFTDTSLRGLLSGHDMQSSIHKEEHDSGHFGIVSPAAAFRKASTAASSGPKVGGKFGAWRSTTRGPTMCQQGGSGRSVFCRQRQGTDTQGKQGSGLT